MRLPRWALWGLLLLGAGALVFGLWPRRPVSIEELAKQKVVRAVRYAEAKQVGDVMDEVSERFRHSSGYGKQELRQVLAGQILRPSWTRIFLVDVDAKETSQTSADVTCRVLFARSDAKELRDLAKDSVVSAYRIDAKIERESDGEWRFVWAQEHRLDPTQLF